jgi:lipopolysaccharide heptosyltransferase I
MNSIMLQSPPPKVLLIKPSSLGDVVHALPVLDLLKRTWPASHVSWLVTPACAGLLQGHPLLDDVILFERGRLSTFWRSFRAAAGLFDLTRQLRQRQFDLVIDLQGLFRSGWLARRTAAPMRVGFADARELAWMFYTHRIDAGSREQHAVDRNLKLARALGCGDGPVAFPIPVDASAEESVNSMLGQPRRLAVLLPGATWPSKRWPADRFAALVAPLKQRFGLDTVLAGGADAAPIASRISGALDLTGRTTLGQLVALLRRADLVIANDSGPMHIAAALGRPLVAIFGPTNPLRTGPYGRPAAVVRVAKSCSPCYRRSRWRCRCIDQIQVEAVLSAAQQELHAATPAVSD